MFRLEKERTIEVPFQKGKTVQVQVGSLWNGPTKLLRYTRSIQPVRARYRITLQYHADSDYTPYVFDCVRNPAGALEISPDNDDARTLWVLSSDPRRADLQQAIETIFNLDIDVV